MVSVSHDSKWFSGLETSSHKTRQGTLIQGRLRSLSHCGLILTFKKKGGDGGLSWWRHLFDFCGLRYKFRWILLILSLVKLIKSGFGARADLHFKKKRRKKALAENDSSNLSSNSRMQRKRHHHHRNADTTTNLSIWRIQNEDRGIYRDNVRMWRPFPHQTERCSWWRRVLDLRLAIQVQANHTYTVVSQVFGLYTCTCTLLFSRLRSLIRSDSTGGKWFVEPFPEFSHAKNKPPPPLQRQHNHEQRELGIWRLQSENRGMPWWQWVCALSYCREFVC